MVSTPEFSRRVALARIGGDAQPHAITAGPEERAALAARFELLAIAAIDAEIALTRSGEAIIAEGRVTAAVTQSCVASGEAVAAQVDAPLHVRFVVERTAADDEIELDSADCDEMPHDDQAVDIGEAAAQTLALALDPYPRAPGAEDVLRAAGVVADDEAATGPFAGLATLFKP